MPARRQFGDQPFALDGDYIPLSKQGTFGAQHILTPKEGVAVHINAYNFPVWGAGKGGRELVSWDACCGEACIMTSYLTSVVAHISSNLAYYLKEFYN